VKISAAVSTGAPSAPVATFSQTQSSSYAAYEYERRLRMLRVISPLLWGLESSYVVGFLAFWLSQMVSGTATFNDHSLLLAALVVNGFFYWGMLAQRRGNVAVASWAITGVMSVAFLFVCISESMTLGINAYTLALLAGFALAIVLAGALGNQSQIVVVTLLALLGTWGTYWMGKAPPLSPGMPALLLGFFFIMLANIALAGIMFAWRSAEQHTVEELQAVRVANERAARLDQLKNSFIASINHEIRNPVMAIMGNVQNLAEAPSAVARERLQRYAMRAFEACLSLRQLLDSILEVRNLDNVAQNIVLQETYLSKVMRSTLALYPDAPIQFAMPPEDLLCRCDPVRLQQILMNLISNAMKYSPAGSLIEIGAWAVPEPAEAGEYAEIVVWDYGLGIPPDDVPLLFNQFIRLQRDIASTVVGNGLGLYLCKTFIEAMGGEIWVESSGIEGEGSAFHLRVPRVATGSAEPQLASMTPTRRRGDVTQPNSGR
jgi:signal transduction histidine kinase